MDKFFLDSHWLKVRERIIYKMIIIVHKCLHFKAPDSLSGVLMYSDSDRTMKLKHLKVKTRFGTRAFSHAGPKLWNLLPQDLRYQHNTDVFKKMLKSYLLLNSNELHSRINMR